MGIPIELVVKPLIGLSYILTIFSAAVLIVLSLLVVFLVIESTEYSERKLLDKTLFSDMRLKTD